MECWSWQCYNAPNRSPGHHNALVLEPTWPGNIADSEPYLVSKQLSNVLSFLVKRFMKPRRLTKISLLLSLIVSHMTQALHTLCPCVPHGVHKVLSCLLFCCHQPRPGSVNNLMVKTSRWHPLKHWNERITGRTLSFCPHTQNILPESCMKYIL